MRIGIGTEIGIGNTQPGSITCTILSPALGDLPIQGVVFTITGTISVPGTVAVKLGSTLLGAATVAGLTWSFSWTPQAGDVGAQTINATATATTGGATANATGAPVVVSASSALTGSLQSVAAGQHWDNSRAFSLSGTAPNQSFTPDYWAYLKFVASGTFTVEAITNGVNRCHVDVEIDGAFFTSLQFTTPGVKQQLSFTIPAGTHVVKLIKNQECQVTGFQGTGFLVMPAAVRRRVILFGASGTLCATPTNSTNNSNQTWYGRFRRIGRFDGGYNRSNSGFGLMVGWGVTDAASAATFVTTQLAPLVDGTAENVVIIEGEAGDQENNQAASAHQTAKQFLFDAIHATFPTIQIWDQDAIFIGTGAETTPNSAGSTMPDFRTAGAAARVGRESFVRGINGLLMANSAADLFDNLHEIDGVDSPFPGTGYAKAFHVIKQAVGQQVQIPIAGTSTNTINVSGVSSSFRSIIGATNTQANWRTDGGITIGTTPLQTGTGGAVTWSGALLREDVLYLEIDGAGTGPAATFKVSVNGGPTGGNTFVQTGIPCAATVTLFAATNAPIVVSWPNVAYSLATKYQATVDTWADVSGNGFTMSAPSIAAQPLLVFNAVNGRRGIKGDGVTSELRSNLTLPASATSSTFIWGNVRVDTWTSGHRIWGSRGANLFILFMNGSSPNLSAFNGSTIPAGGSAGMTVGQFKRIHQFFSGSTNDYMKIGSVSTTGQNFGSAAGVATQFTLFETIASFFGAVTFTEVGVSLTDPGTTKIGQLDTYASSSYGSGVLT